MKTAEVNSVLRDIKEVAKNTNLFSQNKKEKYIKQIETLQNEYKIIEVSDELDDIYESLIKKGKELKSEFKVNANSKELSSKLEYYLRYLKAAKADFKGETNYINKYLRVYIFTSILFLALSPQYFGFVLPAIFFAPIFLGLKGIKSRSRHGFTLSLSVIPVALMTSFIWIRYGIYALGNYQAAITQVIQDTGRSPLTATLLVTVPPTLGLILFALTVMQGYRGYKSKDLFV